MSIKKITREEAIKLCQRQEDDFYDKKSAKLTGAKAQEIAVALANADGGTIAIGIEDEKTGGSDISRWSGLATIEGYNGIIQSIVELSPSIDFTHDFLYIDDYLIKYILIINILKSLKVHETAKKEVYLRKGAQSLKISGLRVQELTRAKGLSAEEDTTLPSIEPEAIVDSPHLKEYLTFLPIQEKDPMSFLVQERLLQLNPVFAPTVAGALLFGVNPSNLLSNQCAVKIARYDSTDEEIDRDSLTNDIYTIEGPLKTIIQDTHKKLSETLSKSIVWTIQGEQPQNYPSDALWEVLVNSVLHRDYAVSDNVLISVYRNRVEFKSPGRLPGYVTPENILSNRFSRNPKLVRALARYPDSINKDLGEGINTIFERMKQMGYIDPIISDYDNCVTVTLRRTPRSDHHSVVKNFIIKHGSINNRQALDILALDKSEQITSIFGKMREKGEIKRSDDSTGARVRWVLDRS